MMDTRKYIINDIEYDVTVNSVTDDRAEVTVNGVRYKVRIEKNVQTPLPSGVETDQKIVEAHGHDVPEVAPATLPGKGRAIDSPLPGVILGVKVQVGERVRCGQVVAVLEAMKMENEIQSETDGVVLSVCVSPGDSILEGAPIVIIG